MNHYSLELDYQPPTQSVFEQIVHMDHPVLLLSNKDGLSYRQNRWDIAAASPVDLISKTQLEGNGIEICEQICEEIGESLAAHCSDNNETAIPFVSGAIGLISYEAGECFLGIAGGTRTNLTQPTATSWPLILVGIYQWAIVTDHLTRKRWLVGDAKMNSGQWQSIVKLVDTMQFTNSISSTVPNNNSKAHKETHLETRLNIHTESSFRITDDWQSSFSSDQYAQAFQRIKNYILDGDCYQSNLTQQFSAGYTGSPWVAAQLAWNSSAAPFSAYIQHGDSAVASCSPECFIQIEKGLTITRPIKGTRPRGTSVEEDAQNAKELHQSPKDKAENLMIVDLMRNDLGRYCNTGSIKTPNLFEVESFSNVHHLVSTISGEIEPDNPAKSLELFLGCLPGGSITGAPKKRAMEIIDELEPHNRSVYCGSMFYLTANGNLNSNIMIRSLLFESSSKNSGTVYCWGGGGIVSDSNLDAEQTEARLKVQNILSALSQ